MDGDNGTASGGGVPFEEDDDFKHRHGFQRIRDNDPLLMTFGLSGDHENITNEDWTRIGRDISNNYELLELILRENSFNEQKISCLFRGLTRGRSIRELRLTENELSAAGVRSMVPFLQNANSLQFLSLSENNIQSEGFNVLLRALRNGPIEKLNCQYCDIASIEIDSENIPKYLKRLDLCGNRINADGCRGLAKLLQGGDTTLIKLYLGNNNIDDEGVEILVEALQKNKALKTFDLKGNHEISKQGKMLLLRLVNDISNIKATLQSNHTLRGIYLYDNWIGVSDKIQRHINRATAINHIHGGNSQTVGREKVIQFQLHSGNRAELTALRQGIEHSVYSEIDPLHLPEVLSLLGRHSRVWGELYGALRSTVVGLFSMVNMRQCIQNEAASRAAKIDEYKVKIDEYKAMIRDNGARVKELKTRLEIMDGSDQNNAEDVEVHNNKRRRV